MYKKVIEKNKEAISYKLDIDMKEVYEAMKLLKDCLKPKYANKFYFHRHDITTFININDDFSIKNLKADYNEWFDSSSTKIYGVGIRQKDNGYEYIYSNIVGDIPIVLKTKADNAIYELRKMIDNINDKIRAELDLILSKNDKYIHCINKEIVALSSKKNFQNVFNENLSKSDIVKKTTKKIEQFFKHKPLGFKIQGISDEYSNIKLGIVAIIEPYVYDRCLDIEFTRDSIFIGTLTLNDNDKHKFEPNFTNQKYFTSEITSIRYMRNTFKKHLINAGLGE